MNVIDDVSIRVNMVVIGRIPLHSHIGFRAAFIERFGQGHRFGDVFAVGNHPDPGRRQEGGLLSDHGIGGSHRGLQK